jgi:nucleoside-diphosphate-sugar epimerase
MSRILVTGGTGFIGSYVVRRLLRERGAHRVRLLVRRLDRIPREHRGAVEAVQGDLTDRAAVRTAMQDVHTVLHLAALARAWSPRPGAFRAANVDAVTVLLEEAERADVERLVHVSTAIAAGAGDTNASAAGGSGPASPYAASKREGEERVLDYAASGRHAVILRPTRVYGPGPLHDANGVTKMLDLYLRGRFRVRLADRDILANYVHADDVAQGILLAARRGVPRAAYTIGGENVSLREFLALASELTGVRRRVLAIPPWAGRALAGAAELSARFGATPFITRAWVRTFLEDRPADIEPARRDLGYAPRSLRIGLAETIAWLWSLDAPQALAGVVT